MSDTEPREFEQAMRDVKTHAISLQSQFGRNARTTSMMGLINMLAPVREGVETLLNEHAASLEDASGPDNSTPAPKPSGKGKGRKKPQAS